MSVTSRGMCVIVAVLKVKVTESRCGPEGSRRFRLPDFHDIRHMKVVRSSASRTGHVYHRKYS